VLKTISTAVLRFRRQVVRWSYRKIGRFSAWAATYQFRKANPKSAVKVVIDNTILDLSISHETRWLSMGEDPFSTRLEDGGYLARVPVHSPSNNTTRYRELTFLNTFGILAKDGFFELAQSSGLKVEQFYQPVGRFKGYGMFDSSVLFGLDIKQIGEPWFPALGPTRFRLPTPQDQFRSMIDSSPDPKFQEFLGVMKSHMGAKCSQDAWHIWQAENADIGFFLTTDRKLLAAWKQLRQELPIQNMKIELHSPTSLGEKLGFLPTHPIAFSYDRQDAIVRTDVLMPGEQRRPRSRYK